MPYPTDYYRFTAEGSELLLKETGFKVRAAGVEASTCLGQLPHCQASGSSVVWLTGRGTAHAEYSSYHIPRVVTHVCNALGRARHAGHCQACLCHLPLLPPPCL